MDRPEPLRLGKYRVLESVARGPLAEVLKARLEGIAGFSRMFAIKRVHEAIAADPDRLARVENAARRAAALLHGNIVQVLDLARDDAGRPYLILEWVDGWNLAAVLDRAREAGTPLPTPQAAWIALQVLNALEVAHGHRELCDGLQVESPMPHGALAAEDVLLSLGGEVKVSDFGLAHVATVLAAENPGLLPDVRPAHEPTIHGDLVDVARLLHAALTLETTRSPLTGRPGVPEPLAQAVDALLELPGADPAAAPATASAFKVAATDALHGHVFTQETLSSWLKGLFGLDDALPAVVRTDSDAALELFEDEFGLDLDLPELPAKDDWTAPEEAIGGGRTLLDEDEDVRTLAQGVAAPTRPVAGTSPAPAGRTGSARTGIVDAVPAPAPEPWEAPAPAAVDPDLASRLAALRRTGPSPADPASDERSVEPAGRLWLGGVAFGLLLVAVGAGIGGIVAGAVGRSAGLTVPTPVLDVRHPAGLDVVVQVDGAPIDGPTPLAAGAHGVRIAVPGADPWTFELPLQEGEYRVIVVDAPTPPPPAATPQQP